MCVFYFFCRMEGYVNEKDGVCYWDLFYFIYLKISN